jgi:hypothetical protein
VLQVPVMRTGVTVVWSIPGINLVVMA